MQINVNLEIDRLPGFGRALLLAAASQDPEGGIATTAARFAKRTIERRAQRRAERAGA